MLKDTTPPLTPTNSGTEQVSSTSDPVSPVRTPPHMHSLYSPAVSPRAHPLSSPQAKLVPSAGLTPPYTMSNNSSPRPSPTYHTVTAAKENQVVLTPPGSTSSNPSKEADRDTSSPYSDLSDESVISVSIKMLCIFKLSIKFTLIHFHVILYLKRKTITIQNTNPPFVLNLQPDIFHSEKYFLIHFSLSADGR